MSVSTSAITAPFVSDRTRLPSAPEKRHTNKRQPHKLQPHERKYRKQDPQHGLRVQRNPKKPPIRRIHLAALLRVRALKHPPRVARRGVYFVPPAQPDEASSRDVLEVVEIRGQEQDGDDEDEDKVFGELQTEEVHEERGCVGRVSYRDRVVGLGE